MLERTSNQVCRKVNVSRRPTSRHHSQKFPILVSLAGSHIEGELTREIKSSRASPLFNPIVHLGDLFKLRRYERLGTVHEMKSIAGLTSTGFCIALKQVTI